MYCDYVSDRAGNVRIHTERKHPKNISTQNMSTQNISTQIEVGGGNNEDGQEMEMWDQLINTMRSSTEDKHTQCGEGVEKMEENYDSKLDVISLENSILSNWNAFKQKLEMGKQIKRIVEEKKVPKICLDKEQMQALKLHEEWICK